MKKAIEVYEKVLGTLIESIESWNEGDGPQTGEITTPQIEALKMSLVGLKELTELRNSFAQKCYTMASEPFMLSLDLDSRTIFFNVDVESGAAVEFLKMVNAIFEYSGKEDPINIVISSLGGDVHACLGIVDIIKSLPCKVNSICHGYSASAAMVIFSACTGKRVMTKNSYLMYHNLWVGMLTGDGGVVDNELKLMKVLQKKMDAVIAENCNEKYGEKWWNRKGSKDMYISAEDAIEYGLATEIA